MAKMMFPRGTKGKAALGIGALALLGLVLAMRRKGDQVEPVKLLAGDGKPPGGRRWTTADADAMARTLIMEIGGKKIDPEWAAIAFCMVNRAIKYKRPSIWAVVERTDWTGTGARVKLYMKARRKPAGEKVCGPVTSKGVTKTVCYASPAGHSRYAAAKRFATELLKGKIRNPIGTAKNYLHPRGMPKDTPENRKKYSKHVPFEGRMLPKWAVSSANGGTAARVVRLGLGLFA